MSAEPLAPTVPWGRISRALGASIVATIVLGGGLFLWNRSVWWIALGSCLALLGTGLYLGWSSGKKGAALEATILTLLYYGLTVVFLFAGELTETLPDPLPGLPIGDSTFFFVWPLAQLFATVSGALVGGRLGSARQASADR